jgi:hypothetical protein
MRTAEEDVVPDDPWAAGAAVSHLKVSLLNLLCTRGGTTDSVNQCIRAIRSTDDHDVVRSHLSLILTYVAAGQTLFTVTLGWTGPDWTTTYNAKEQGSGNSISTNQFNRLLPLTFIDGGVGLFFRVPTRATTKQRVPAT